MDPLTHALTGLTLSRCGVKRWCGEATWVLVLAATAPDIEVLSLAGGPTVYLHYHRHLTHSLVMMPVMALLPLLVVRFLMRRALNWKRAYALALLGVATHLGLDWTNIYGIRLLLPFSDRWFRLDITNLIDVWIWAALLLAALGPALSRLVSSEIGARPGSGRGVALLALGLLLSYEFGRYLLHQRAVAVLESRLYNGLVPSRVAALPGAINPFRWQGLVETPGFYSVQPVDLLGEFDPADGRIFYKPEPGPAETAAWEAARQTETFRVFLQFSQYPLQRFTPLEEPTKGIRVEVMDLRFGTPPRPRFVATALVGEDGRVRRSWFAYDPPAR
jgi:inner membrane protein